MVGVLAVGEDHAPVVELVQILNGLALIDIGPRFSAIGRADDAAKARKELMDRYPDSEWAKKGP